MSVIDILFRVDTICQKYDKYDIDKQRELNAYGDDAFARLYAAVESSIQAALNVPFSSLFLFLVNFLYPIVFFFNQDKFWIFKLENHKRKIFHVGLENGIKWN